MCFCATEGELWSGLFVHTHTLSLKKKKQLGSLGSVMGKLERLANRSCFIWHITLQCDVCVCFTDILFCNFVQPICVNVGSRDKKNVFGFSPATPQTAASKGSYWFPHAQQKLNTVTVRLEDCLLACMICITILTAECTLYTEPPNVFLLINLDNHNCMKSFLFILYEQLISNCLCNSSCSNGGLSSFFLLTRTIFWFRSCGQSSGLRD